MLFHTFPWRHAIGQLHRAVHSLYKRQLIRLNMKKRWPTWTGMEDSRPIFFWKRFSYNENALYLNDSTGWVFTGHVCDPEPTDFELER